VDARASPEATDIGEAGGARGRSLKRLGLTVVFAFLLAVVSLVLDRLNIAPVETVDRLIGDYRIALLSPQAPRQRSDIAIVLITEETLLDYDSRSPIDRGLLAEMIRAIDAAGPKAIGLDFIFDRRTKQDSALLAAITAAKAPVVLGAIDARVPLTRDSLAYQRDFFARAGRPYGHFMLERKSGVIDAGRDSRARLVGQSYPDSSGPPAFSAVLARAAGYTHEPENRQIAWLREPAEQPLFTTIEIPRHDPAAMHTTVAETLLGPLKEALQGRVVLIGAAMIDRDRHTTPLSVLDGASIHGIYIQAQALAQRIDGDRDVWHLPWYVSLPGVGVLGLICFFVARFVKLQARSYVYEVFGLVLIGLLSCAAFWYWRLDIPSIALATAWLGGAIGGRKSDWAFQKLGLQH
jgi:adenylate cyclase